MSQGVELDRPQTGVLQEPLEYPPAKVVLAERIALAVDEDPGQPPNAESRGGKGRDGAIPGVCKSQRVQLVWLDAGGVTRGLH